MLRFERNQQPFQLGFQNLRAQTCSGNTNFRLHRLATDTDLTKEMKWFRNSNFPEKRVTFSNDKDKTFASIRLRSSERQRTFGGFDSNDQIGPMSLAGTKMDVSDGKKKRDEPKLWSQELSRSLPSVAECVTPPSLPLQPALKQRPLLRKSYTFTGSSAHDNTKGKLVEDNMRNDKKRKSGLQQEFNKNDEKLPKISREKENEDINDNTKSTQTSAKRPDGGWRSLRGESRSSQQSSRSRRSHFESQERVDCQLSSNPPKFLPEVQSAREGNRRNESFLPVQPLPNLFTPANAPTMTPCNTITSGTTITPSNLTITPESRNSFPRARRCPVPFKKIAHHSFLV